eukprot:1489801-Pyramimonas_sp.AAC.1
MYFKSKNLRIPCMKDCPVTLHPHLSGPILATLDGPAALARASTPVSKGLVLVPGCRSQA